MGWGNYLRKAFMLWLLKFFILVPVEAQAVSRDEYKTARLTSSANLLHQVSAGHGDLLTGAKIL